MILTFIEIRDGKIKKSSLEALSEAKRRAGEMDAAAAAVLVGPESAAAELRAHGAAKVYLLENPQLDAYSAQGYAA
ncbi:MAG: electron transfer flavoprotein subunit alpha/FixB family protein, partial [Candidatus Aminicenantales bacterium]